MLKTLWHLAEIEDERIPALISQLIVNKPSYIAQGLVAIAERDPDVLTEYALKILDEVPPEPSEEQPDNFGVRVMVGLRLSDSDAAVSALEAIVQEYPELTMKAICTLEAMENPNAEDCLQDIKTPSAPSLSL